MRNTGYLFNNLIVNFTFGSYESWDERMVVELALCFPLSLGFSLEFCLPLDERLDINFYTVLHYVQGLRTPQHIKQKKTFHSGTK